MPKETEEEKEKKFKKAELKKELIKFQDSVTLQLKKMKEKKEEVKEKLEE